MTHNPTIGKGGPTIADADKDTARKLVLDYVSRFGHEMPFDCKMGRSWLQEAITWTLQQARIDGAQAMKLAIEMDAAWIRNAESRKGDALHTWREAQTK